MSNTFNMYDSWLAKTKMKDMHDVPLFPIFLDWSVNNSQMKNGSTVPLNQMYGSHSFSPAVRKWNTMSIFSHFSIYLELGAIQMITTLQILQNLVWNRITWLQVNGD